MNFKEKVSIVTGAATGIGLATASKFGEYGATVILADIDEEGVKRAAAELKQKGVQAVAMKLDISNLSEINNFVDLIYKQFHQVDVLVNNAGKFSTTPIMEMTESEWDLVMDINLKGTFFLCKEVLKNMMKRKYGKIVNISSLAAKRGGVTSGINYAASKAGVLAVTTCLAKYSASYGINVNAVIPAFCDTKMFRSLPEEKIKNAINSIPLGRPANPEELADAVLFLSSDMATYITGEILDVNGGVLMD